MKSKRRGGGTRLPLLALPAGRSGYFCALVAPRLFLVGRSRLHPTLMLSHESTPPATSRFRQTLIRVMTVQVVTLLALWLLQARYSG